LNFAPWEQAFGAVLETLPAIPRGPVARFAAFPTDAQGFAAMSHLLVVAYSGLTLQRAIARWAPASENDTQAYISNVCAWTGLTPSTVLTVDLLQPPQIA